MKRDIEQDLNHPYTPELAPALHCPTSIVFSGMGSSGYQDLNTIGPHITHPANPIPNCQLRFH